MRTTIRLAGPTSARADQAAFTALTPVEGIVGLQIASGTIIVEHDGRVTLDALRAALAVAGLEIARAVEEPRSLPLL